MLTTDQKEAILRRAGVAIPSFPARGLASQQQQQQGDPSPRIWTSLQAGAEPGAAVEQWTRAIDALFAEYSAARSLRDADEARRRGARRQAQDSSSM
jgi:hypothetical protein